MSAPYNYATGNRPTPWAWMIAATCALTLATLAVLLIKLIF